jgi:zinc/manganese transport system substrate-binding protein
MPLINFKEHMKIATILVGITSLALAHSSDAKLNIVATTADFGAIAKEIAGDNAEVTTLAKPTEDPHFVDAKPGFITKLNRADLLIEGGAELEQGWLTPLLENARNSKIVAGAPGRVMGNAGVKMLGIPATLDRSRGDIHAAGNPHYLVDPANARIVAANIGEALCKVDSKSCEVYRANQKRFQQTIDGRLLEWQKELAPYKGAHLVAYHDSWPYFAERFGLKIELFLEPRPGIPPTPSHLTTLVQRMHEQNARVILVDAYLNRRHAQSIAARTGAVTVPVTHFPGGQKGTEGGYVPLIDYLVRSISQALAKQKAN